MHSPFAKLQVTACDRDKLISRPHYDLMEFAQIEK